jgi:hypothetical protein
MNTNISAFILLIASVAGLEISGLWMMRLGRSNERKTYSAVGKILCGSGILFLGLGIIGLLLVSSPSLR